MNNDIKEIYLSGLEWTKTHNNIGGVMGNFVFKHNISYEEYLKIIKNTYFVLCDKDYITNLQNKLNQYENPDDMTLMFMWCDEKAKDKIKQLQEENKRLNNIINKLEKWLKEETMDLYDKDNPMLLDDTYIKYATERKMAYMYVLDKLKELKEDNK